MCESKLKASREDGLGTGFYQRFWQIMGKKDCSEPTIHVALYCAFAMQFALEMGFAKIILESDSRTIIKNLQATKEDYSEIRLIIWDEKALARIFSSCCFEFVARE
ncbi:hypothetical protein Gorai_009241, partial [Gossypium raimondii]|nr:hypothetical protein [Gossypium raimondii]